MGHEKLLATTLVVAASNSSKSGKELADVVCTGTNDHTTINDALNALPAGVAAKVIFLVGTYSLAGPVILDRDWLTIEGEQHPMWGYYTGPYPSAAAEGSTCAKFKVVTSGVNAIQFGPNNMTGTDSRRRGMAVRSLYLYGYNRTGTGIYNGGSGGGGHMDWCAFEWNMIHNFANGIDVYADTPQIAHNSIQDCSGDGIKTAGAFGMSTGNLVFDIGGDGIYPLSHGHIVSSNIVGHVGRGCIALGGDHQVASGNHCFCSSSAAVSAMSALAEAASMTGNTILQPATKSGIQVLNTHRAAITGNTLKSTASDGIGIAIELGTSTGCTVTGNVITGTWGTPIERGADNIIGLNSGYVSSTTGVASIGDGGSIAHGLGGIPLHVSITGSSAGEIVSLTSVDATNLTVAIKTSDGSAGTTQIVYWRAELGNGSPVPALVTSAQLAGWWKADSLSLSDDATVTTLPDASGLGLTLTASGSPTFKTNIQNGLPAIRLNGTSGYLANGTGPLRSQPITVFVVATQASNSSGAKSLFNSRVGNTAALFINESQLIGLYAGSIGTGPSQTIGSAHVFEAVVNGSSSSVGVDGSLTTVNPGIQGLGGGVTLGANSTVTGEFFNGDIFEAVLYKGAMSTSERSAVRTTLSAKWGITAS
jgi:Periplasmic copper-binding protein (NosD)